MTRMRIVIAGLMLLVVGGLIYFLQSKPSVPDGAPKKVSLRLQWLDQAQFAGFYVAEAKGFYRKHGLDVQIHSGGPDFNAMTLVASGSDTFGIWTGDQLVLAKSKGVPLAPIGAIFNRSLAAFMVKSSSDIRSPKDFENHTVGMYYGYDTETIYLYLLKKFHVDRSKVRETPVQFDLARFFDGTIDVWPAYAINQPITAAQNGIQVRLLTPELYGVKYYSDILFAREDYLKSNPQVVSAFLAASIEGWTYALAHRDEAIDIVLARSPHLDRKQQRAMLDVVAKYINLTPQSNFLLDPATWQSIENLLQAQGLLKQTIPISDLTRGNKVAR